MNKLVVISTFTFFICFTAGAQKTDVSKVPSAVKASFEKKYPGVAATWEKEAGMYEANFKQNGNSISVLMDEKGIIAETEVDIKVTELPAAIQAYVKEHYKGMFIKEAAKIIKADGSIQYEAAVAGKDVLFDANGKFLKEIKD